MATNRLSRLTNFGADVNPEPSFGLQVGSGGAFKPKLNMPQALKMPQPLTIAVTQSNDEIVKILLEKGAQVSIPNADGWKNIHYAAYNGNASIVEMLIDYGGDVNDLTLDGTPPLCLASQEGHTDVVTLLLKHGANVNYAQQDGATALVLAAQLGHDDVVKILLKYKAVTTVKVNGKPVAVLHLALQNKHTSTADILLNHERMSVKDSEASTLLLLASYLGNAKAVKKLLSLGADTETRLNGTTPLTMAVVQGHKAIVKILLQHGADVQASPSHDDRLSIMTPLALALHTGRKDILKLILDHGPKNLVNSALRGYETKPVEYTTPMEYIAHSDNLDIFNLLLEYGADATLKSMKPRKYNMPILCQVSAKVKVKFVKALLDHGVDTQQSCGNDTNAFMLAMHAGHQDVTEMFLKYGVPTEVVFQGNSWPVLTLAIMSGQTNIAEIVEIFLKHGTDTEVVDNKYQLTPLCTAAGEGHIDVVKLLLDHGANKDAMSMYGTPLFMAAEQGYFDTVQILLHKGVDIELSSKQNRATPLIVAAQNGHVNIVKVLLDHGANVNAELQTPADSWSVYQHIDILAEDKGWAANVVKDALDDDMKKQSLSKFTYFSNALIQAIFFNQPNVVKLLLQHGANTEAKYRYLDYKYTPLIMATLCGYKDIVEALLKSGADINGRDPFGTTALHLAVFMKNKNMISLLLRYGADKSARTVYGETPWEMTMGSELENQKFRDLFHSLPKKLVSSLKTKKHHQ